MCSRQDFSKHTREMEDKAMKSDLKALKEESRKRASCPTYNL